MIKHNKNPSDHASRMLLGVCNIADGLVSILSIGFLHSSFALEYARNNAKKRAKEIKANNA